LAWLEEASGELQPRRSGRPLVCFTGTLRGKTRKQWLDEAVANGWDTTDEPSRFTDVLVAADPEGKSAKLKAARTFSTAIVSAEEWQEVMFDGVLEELP
jgi:NAD-dependent DNA ligase